VSLISLTLEVKRNWLHRVHPLGLTDQSRKHLVREDRVRRVTKQVGGFTSQPRLGSPTVVSSMQLVRVNSLQRASSVIRFHLVESHSGSMPPPRSSRRADTVDGSVRVLAELGPSVVRPRSIPIRAAVSSQTTQGKPYILCKQPSLQALLARVGRF
jgi:hypothetical protein